MNKHRIKAFTILEVTITMLITALLVRLTSRGPALYRQERVGLHGEQFRVWKFRSMRCGSDKAVAELMAAHGG